MPSGIVLLADGKNAEVVFETGIQNRTQDEAPDLLHQGKDRSGPSFWCDDRPLPTMRGIVWRQSCYISRTVFRKLVIVCGRVKIPGRMDRLIADQKLKELSLANVRSEDKSAMFQPDNRM